MGENVGSCQQARNEEHRLGLLWSEEGKKWGDCGQWNSDMSILPKVRRSKAREHFEHVGPSTDPPW